LTQLKAVVGSQSPHFIYALHVEVIDESVQCTSVWPHMLAFLTHFLNSHNPSLADQFLIWSNSLQTGQEFKILLQHVHIKLEIACQSWDFARRSI